MYVVLMLLDHYETGDGDNNNDRNGMTHSLLVCGHKWISYGALLEW